MSPIQLESGLLKDPPSTLTREKRQLSLRAKNNLHLQLEWIIEIAVFQNSCAFSGVFFLKTVENGYLQIIHSYPRIFKGTH